MKTVVYTCSFVPPEWIAAHGVRPCRWAPIGAPAPGAIGPVTGLCAMTRAWLGEVGRSLPADALIMTTVCDPMRRASEIAAELAKSSTSAPLPLFLMNVPSTWQTPAARGLYRSELRRLGGFLIELGGRAPAPADLSQVLLDYEARRAALHAMRSRLAPSTFARAIRDFTFNGDFDPALYASAPPPRGPALALLGDLLFDRKLELFARIEAAGGHVALDATGSGERALPAPFDPAALARDPLSALADAYFGSIPDPSFRPDTALYDWLQRNLRQRNIRGIIFCRSLGCDLWNAEAQRMKDWAEVPLLILDLSQEGGHDAHAASRIHSFLEMLA